MRFITLAAPDGASDLAESLLLLHRLRTEHAPSLPEGLLVYLHTQARFIVAVARQYEGNGMTWPQLLDAGQRGLIRAWEAVQGEPARLDQMGGWWVRQAILQVIPSATIP